MRRADDAYWQRLRKDKRSTAAGSLTILAWLVATVAVGMLVAPGSQFEARGNPLYWIVMVPFVWWANALASYKPGPVRWLRAAQIVAPLVVLVAALAAPSFGEDSRPFWVATGVATVASALGAIFHRGSLINLEGPAR